MHNFTQPHFLFSTVDCAKFTSRFSFTNFYFSRLPLHYTFYFLLRFTALNSTILTTFYTLLVNTLLTIHITVPLIHTLVHQLIHWSKSFLMDFIIFTMSYVFLSNIHAWIIINIRDTERNWPIEKFGKILFIRKPDHRYNLTVLSLNTTYHTDHHSMLFYLLHLTKPHNLYHQILLFYFLLRFTALTLLYSPHSILG